MVQEVSTDFFGGKLTTYGHKVTLIARGTHLKAIQEKGLEIKSITGDFIIRPHRVTNDIASIETPKLVIFGVKSWQLLDAVRAVYNHCDSNTIFLPLQNGADNVEKLNTLLPKGQVLAGLYRMIIFYRAIRCN